MPYEDNFKHSRERMVKEQLERRDIKDKKVLDVFRKVPRHRFVDPTVLKSAYSDYPLSIGEGQTISQPYIVSLMVELLDVKKSDRVLEIGTGSGYETAILAELAEAVFSIERIAKLADQARLVLEELGYKNIHIKIGDGTLGWEEESPFDKIIVTASSPDVPKPYLGQLKMGGRIVIPIGSRFSQQLLLIEKDANGNLSRREGCGCVFVPLIGKHGWAE